MATTLQDLLHGTQIPGAGNRFYNWAEQISQAVDALANGGSTRAKVSIQYTNPGTFVTYFSGCLSVQQLDTGIWGVRISDGAGGFVPSTSMTNIAVVATCNGEPPNGEASSLPIVALAYKASPSYSVVVSTVASTAAPITPVEASWSLVAYDIP